MSPRTCRRADTTPKPVAAAQGSVAQQAEQALSREVSPPGTDIRRILMSGGSGAKRSFAKQAEKTAQDERAIQQEIDRKDAEKQKQGGKEQKEPMQAGTRRYPGSFAEQ